MLVLLLFLLTSFDVRQMVDKTVEKGSASIAGQNARSTSNDGQNTTAKRDMVYYNEQQKLIEQAIAEGMEREAIEEMYDCQILFREDAKYEILLKEAFKQEALIMDYFENDRLAGKFIWDDKAKYYDELESMLFKQTILVWMIVLFGGYILLGFLYVWLLRPFQSLQRFSRQVAKGNLDLPLPVYRQNYFGAFTESFDLMREELKRARESEYQANKSKKELMAELSHDIKTPIATIQATCEVMQIKEKNPDTLEKVATIDSKAKMIHKLVDNLFHATLEELTVLKVEPVEESSRCIAEMFSQSDYFGEMTVTGDIPECLIYVDRLRLQQVIDNCLNNAWKYAGTEIFIDFKELENGIWIKIKDNGDGISEEELPLILEKFYRGSNAKGKEGSGLGLYLAKLFMQKMKGDMECYNDEGFVVQLFLRKV